MSEKTVNPLIKSVLEIGPTIAFFLIYLRLKDQTFPFHGQEYSGFIVAALVFIPILLVAMAILWSLTGKLGRTQIVTAVLVIFFGVYPAPVFDATAESVKSLVTNVTASIGAAQTAAAN